MTNLDVMTGFNLRQGPAEPEEDFDAEDQEIERSPKVPFCSQEQSPQVHLSEGSIGAPHDHPVLPEEDADRFHPRSGAESVRQVVAHLDDVLEVVLEELRGALVGCQEGSVCAEYEAGPQETF